MLRRSRRTSVLCALIFCVSGCAESSQTSLRYEGSSTLASAAMPALARAFEENTGWTVSVTEGGSSLKAVSAVVSQKADLGGLSRSLSERERELNIYSQIVGYDAIAVLVHSSNPIWALSHEQVEALFSGRIKNWRELGGRDAAVELVVESSDDGHATGSVFQRVALGGVPFGPHVRQENKAQVLEYVATHPSAVTFAPLGLSRPELHPIAVDGLSPSHENVVSGAYPLSRSLVLVADKLPEGTRRAFFDFVLSEQGQRIVADWHAPVVAKVTEGARRSVGASLQADR